MEGIGKLSGLTASETRCGACCTHMTLVSYLVTGRPNDQYGGECDCIRDSESDRVGEGDRNHALTDTTPGAVSIAVEAADQRYKYKN